MIEEETGIRPPYGWIVLGDRRRERVDNTAELREWVLDVAEQIRAARRRIQEPIPVRQPAAKCRACGMRDGCRQWGQAEEGLTCLRPSLANNVTPRVSRMRLPSRPGWPLGVRATTHELILTARVRLVTRPGCRGLG